MTDEIREKAWEKIKIKTRRADYIYSVLYNYELFPSLFLNEQELVKGEFFRVENIEATLTGFDQIKGFENFADKDYLFKRSLVKSLAGDGHDRLALVYLKNRSSTYKIIPLYNWRNKKHSNIQIIKRI